MGPKTHRRTPGAVRSEERSAPALLWQLAAEYPELSWPTVAQALDQACVAAVGLDGAAAERRVVVFARDRLDVARERADLAARRVARLRPAG